ncbi:hypothetical protein DICPUDRAFT_159871 [Dictyostelium purpureum]|uniref:DJ-1/PfpI domain-containing protein n=1 Tax=Dictyostelium purpureum TaxID=5786 RepID=F1A563_DICPU|nr:uncharacterized protein DICPUDRAFT_159871 [Dictyostelium purpureum]EGC28669.1 hypothetical protein DICPUDRAFT_159871 [Dictyostelium purpureum]|eukprot:XP_003294807.1 hypothetical protein DICPUDRAFT_159871 [Dictyostelium purpureum]
MNKVKLAIFIFDGFEEIEAVTTIDLLRRANILVDIVSVENKKKLIKGSHYIEISADISWDEFNAELYNGIIIPGGPGINKLLLNEQVVEMVKKFGHANNKTIAAICAAPQILGKSGLLVGKKVTHFPGCKQFMDGAFEEIDKAAIADGNIITGASAGVSQTFALKIVEHLKGIEASTLLYNQICPPVFLAQQ